MNTNFQKPEPPEWERLKAIIKRVGYGEVRILIQAGKPVRVEEGVKAIKLDGSQGEFSQGLDAVSM